MGMRSATGNHSVGFDDRERVRDANPIEEVVQDYGHVLLPDGRNLKALCPFHSEKTPSFKISPERGTYTCFGCGEKGDVFSFVQKVENLTSFPETLQLLAERGGVTLTRRFGPGGPAGPGGPRHGLERKDEYKLLEKAQRWFSKELVGPRGAAARKYLEDRGFRDETLREFAVGYAPAGWSNLVDILSRELSREGVGMEAAIALGLARPGKDGRAYDAFRDRIIFPIRDLRGRVVGFGARALGDESPKYINTGESHLFRKGRLLYGLYEGRETIRRGRVLWLTEGYTDVMMAHQHGFDSAVATLGTALTEANTEQIARHADRVELLFDGDKAGREAARKSIALFLPHDVEIRVALLAGGVDPCDLLNEVEGPERLQRAVETSVSGLEFVLEEGLRVVGKESGERKDRVAREFFAVVDGLPSEIRRRDALHRLAAKLDLPESAVELDHRRWRREREPGTRRKRMTRPADRAPEGGADAGKGGIGALLGDEDAVLLGALAQRARGTVLFSVFPPESFSSPARRELARALIEGRGSVDVLELEDPNVKSKYLELDELIADRGFDEERTLSVLRDVLVHRLVGRRRELTRALASVSAKSASSTALREHEEIRADIERLHAMKWVRERTEEHWDALLSVAGRRFGASELFSREEATAGSHESGSRLENLDGNED